VGILPPDEPAVEGTKTIVENLLEGEPGEVNLVKTMNPVTILKDYELGNATAILPESPASDLPADAPLKLG
jgi:hypothetical protein